MKDFITQNNIQFFIYALIIASYIVGSMALFRMAKLAQINDAWPAWVPIGNYYVIGMLLQGNFTIVGHRIDSPEKVLPMSVIAGLVASQVPIIKIPVGIAVVILLTYTTYHLLKKYKGQYVIALTALCTVVPIAYSFILFAIRNNNPIDASYGRGEENLE